jgi:lipid II:glycine glycyltransferase (peptidoglycan interpeptide bridge formation enzyme)
MINLANQNFYILNTSKSNEWKNLLEYCDKADIFHDPNYIRLLEWEGSFGDTPELFVYEDNNKFILNPYFLRDLKSLPFQLDDSNSGALDIISPYGYAGAIANISDYHKNKKLIKNFFTTFFNYANERKIISEFDRLNPYLENHFIYDLSESQNIMKLQQVVYIDLRNSEDDLLMSMDQSHRRYLRKSLKNDLEFFITTKLDDMKEFENIYKLTMDHVNASKNYYYREGFFTKALDYLKDKIALGVIRHNGRMISGALFIWFKDIVHYWYGGSLPEFRNLYPNNLLFFEAAKFFKNEGFKFLNMGGGKTSSVDDNLFKFKYRFSKLTNWFYIYKKILNIDEYHKLTQLHDKYLQKTKLLDSNTNISDSFFPKYRENLF